MKKAKDRITLLQFETALREQIVHARGMNIPANAVSSAASFCLLIKDRLFGPKPMNPDLQKVYTEAVQAALEERSRAARAAQEENERQTRKIILPGDRVFHKGNN